jgi:hypothetical protein
MMPRPPRCLIGLDDSRAGLQGRAAAAVGVAKGLRACGLAGPARLVVLLNALVIEVAETARGEESEAIEYLAAALGRLVGEQLGADATLRALPPQGQA